MSSRSFRARIIEFIERGLVALGKGLEADAYPAPRYGPQGVSTARTHVEQQAAEQGDAPTDRAAVRATK